MESRDSSPSSEERVPPGLRNAPAFAERELQLADVLGVGGHSIVYRAHDRRHGRDVAVKLLRDDQDADGATERFAQEVRVAAGLRHPNILPLFDSGALEDGRLFAVMPVAHGRPLRAMIDEGPLAVADAIRLAREVAEALAYLHDRGWVHRDVKPENILVESGHAVLTDFGVAAQMHAITPRSSPEQVARLWGPSLRITQAGFVVGTLHYMCPEVLFENAPVDARADVYALGLVLYEMLAGELPFTARSAAALVSERMAKPLPLLNRQRDDVPPALDAAIAKATAVDPDERFRDIPSFIVALDAVTTRSSAARTELTVRERDRRLAVLAIALLAGIGTAIGVLRARQADALDVNRIVVADLANETGDSALERIGPLAGDLVTAELSERTKLDVVNATVALGSRQRVQLPSADSSLRRDTRNLVREAHAGLVVTGAYYLEHGALHLVAEVTDTRGGRILGAVGPLHGDARAPEVSLQALADSVVVIVQRRHAPPE